MFSIRQSLKKCVSLCLAVAMVMTMPGTGNLTALAAGTDNKDASYANTLAGWSVESVWSRTPDKNEASNTYEWHATYDQTMQPKVKTTYRLENPKHDYPAGSLEFTVPGIGTAYRASIMEADYTGKSKPEESEWNVTWDKMTDVYTFTNKFEVKAGTSVSGGFEIIWTMNARDCINDFSQEKSTTFSVTEDGTKKSITLPPIKYAFTSTTDNYRIEMTGRRLTGAEYDEVDHDHYIWYYVQTAFFTDWLSRALYKSSYRISVPLPSGATEADVAAKTVSGTPYTIKKFDDGTYGFYPFENKYGNIGSKYYTERQGFYIGFKKGLLDGTNVTINGHLDRLYNDESTWKKTGDANNIVDGSVSFAVADYSFGHSGFVYNLEKWTNGGYERSNNYDDHNEPSNKVDRLNSTLLYQDKIVDFSLQGEAHRNYSAGRSAVAAASETMDSEVTSSDERISDALNGITRSIKKAVRRAAATTGHLTTGAPNTSDVSKVTDKYDMIIGDDKMSIELQNGTIRNLTDDEYDFTYVTIPSDKYGYDYEVFGAKAQDPATPKNSATKFVQSYFDTFEKIGTGNTRTESTIRIPDGYKSVFVRINNITGSYVKSPVHFGVKFHLDEEKEAKKATGERINPDGKIVNFGYFRAIYVDGDVERNDCGLAEQNYSGSYGKVLANRDITTYGEYLLRDYSHIWLRSSVTSIESRTSISSFSKNSNIGRSATVYSAGEIIADNEGPLQKFSLYTILPDGFTFDLDEGNVSVTGSGTKLYNDGGKPDFQNHVRYSMQTVNGRNVLVSDFDFSDNPLAIDKDTTVRVSIPVNLTNSDYITYGSSYNVETFLIVQDGGLDKFEGRNIKDDHYDLNKNGSTGDKAAYSSYAVSLEDSASEWRENVAKYIKSAYSAGYVTETATRLYTKADSDENKAKSDYEYRLDFTTGASNTKDIWFFDSIEQGARIAKNKDHPNDYTNIDSEWQGVLRSVDTSHAEKQGFKPTVYYSTKVLDKATFNPKNEHPDTDSTWTTTAPADMSTVKSIAVRLDTSGLENGYMATKQLTYIVLKMRAPENTKFVEKKAVNQHFVRYNGYNLKGESIGQSYLPSDETYITLYDNIGKLVIQKVDADNILSTKNGVTTYAPLTGATIRITDANGKEIYNGSTNSMGRIVIKTVRAGKYYWEELTAPKGYEKLTGKHEFTITDTSSVINIENHRVTGTIVLTKEDKDHAAYNDSVKYPNQLAGAVFEIYNSKNEKVYTDAKDTNGYAYSKTGSNTTFVTDENGKLRISGLPWDIYRIHEVTAPKGYEVGEDITVNIDRDNVVDENNKAVVFNKTVTDSEKTASIVLTKQDEVSKEVLNNAYYDVYRYNDDSADAADHKWVKAYDSIRTNSAGEIKIDNLKFGKYRFVETQPPKGYLLNTKDSDVNTTTLKAELTKDTVETIVNITATDPRKPGSASLVKTNEEGIALSGAEFALYKKRTTDTLIKDKLTTDENGEIARINNLSWGDYYFVETKAPKGYVLDNTKIEFTLDKDSVGNSNDVKAAFEDTKVNKRTRGSAVLYKKDAATKEVIRGTSASTKAEFELYKNDGTKVPVALQEDGIYLATDEAGEDAVYTMSTNDNGTIIVGNLDWGAYYFSETKAPEGYSVSTDKSRFVINESNCTVRQETECFDETAMAKLVIDKEINEWYEPFGQASFIFEIKGTTEAGEKRHWSEIITLGPKLSGSVTINVPTGIYEVKEKNVARYKLTAISKISGEVAIDTTGATVTLVKQDATSKMPEAEVKFTNQLDQYRPFSHSVNTENLIAKQHGIVSMKVNYTGPAELNAENANAEDKTAYEFHATDMTATVLYDDGVERDIPFNELSLNPSTVVGKNNSSGSGYEVTVSYKENGVTVSDSFTVIVNLPVMNRFKVTYDANGGYFGADTSKTTNSVDYQEKKQLVRKISKTDNVKEDGSDYSGSYGNNVNKTEVITIPDATELKVTITYQTESTSYDWVCMWEGAHPEYTAENNYGSSKTRKLAGKTKTTKEYTVTGDSVTFGFRSDGSGSNYFGYYAVVEGNGIAPTVKNGTFMQPFHQKKLFVGWYTDAACTDGHELSLEDCENDTTVYAKWREPVTTLKNDANLKNALEAIAVDKKTITAFKRSETMPDMTVMTDKNIISTNDSEVPIYCWKEGTELKYWSKADTINTGTDIHQIFYNYKQLSDISGLSLWSTGNVANTSSMFSSCSSLTDITPLSSWNTGNVTNMSFMFSGCSGLTDLTALSSWNTGNVTNMSSMFNGCSGLTDLTALSSWNTVKVMDMSSMFSGCSSLTDLTALSLWSTGNVGNTSSMFSGCSSLTNITPLSSWNTGKVMSMSSMFSGCSSLTNITPLSSWDTGKVTSMSFMFSGCSSLTNITPLSSWDTGKVTSMSFVFNGCSSLKDLTPLSSWNTGNVTSMAAMFNGCSSLTDLVPLSSWDIGNVRSMGAYYNSNYYGMFEACTSLKSLKGLESWNVGKVTDMVHMFDGCSNLTNIAALSSWNTGYVKDVDHMFNGCENITDVTALSSWNVGKVTDMSYMFAKCSKLTNLSGLSSWNTENVTDTQGMFYYCKSITDITALSSWNMGNLRSAGAYYNYDHYGMFEACINLKSLKGLELWNTENVVNMRQMFKSCGSITSLAELSKWNTGKVDNMREMFFACMSLTNLTGLSTWNTKNVTNMDTMFYYCKNLTDASAINNWDITNVTIFGYMFKLCPTHPNFTKRAGTWSEGEFKPAA